MESKSWLCGTSRACPAIGNAVDGGRRSVPVSAAWLGSKVFCGEGSVEGVSFISSPEKEKLNPDMSSLMFFSYSEKVGRQEYVLSRGTRTGAWGGANKTLDKCFVLELRASELKQDPVYKYITTIIKTQFFLIT
jgi:hypothetical protein